MKINKTSHWAYRRENEGYLAQIRRDIEESNIPGWEVITERTEGSMLPHKIMKFEAPFHFQGKQYQVLFLESWYYDEGNRDSVECLFSEM